MCSSNLTDYSDRSLAGVALIINSSPDRTLRPAEKTPSPVCPPSPFGSPDTFNVDKHEILLERSDIGTRFRFVCHEGSISSA